MALDQVFLDNLLATNKQKGVTWQAGPTSLLNLSAPERKARLGYVPGPGEPTLPERERTASLAYQPTGAVTAGPQSTYPLTWDWRNVGGNNYISAIKDQGSCGSCVAFGTAATLDGSARVVRKTPVNSVFGNAMQDLSEAQLFYCGAEGQDGRTCATGWWPASALNYAQVTGVAPESYFPYEAGDQPCRLNAGWQTKLTTLNQSGYLTTPVAMKQWLATRGPLIACFSVYADFYGYSSGVYRYNGSAPYEGGHCISVIGYDDNQQAWLCKNSWGTGWGMGGYFLIGYGQCGIDAGMWSIISFSRIESEMPAGISRALGVITVDGGRPYAFVEGTDGNVWVDYWGGSAWYWANQGRPSGVAVSSTVGATTVDGGRPYLFVQGSDGNMWVNWWSGSAWSWSNQGKPDGTAIAGAVGAITVDSGRPYAFVKGGDGNLWVNWWSGSAWSWSNQSKPQGATIVESVGAITVDGGRPYAFVKASDGNLWVNWWSGSAWSWSNQGQPSGAGIASAVGAITVDGGRPYAFIQGSDGNLWVNWWNGSAWHWSNQGRPSGAGIASAVGAITVDGGRPYAFIHGSDGNLWVNWWDGSAWHWSNQGTPPGVGITSAVGAITVDGGRPYVFVKGSDGNLWSNWWGSGAWHWTNQGGAA
ncbi:C1 family peptidase [Trinickia fusca]|uniref:Peptidase C1A papain C-terminal domain-containing protein n=1 Tax=Trinickia fusca TaxID=2419777 RepID=A0A494XAZ8_9BURK|nr:C1 family peptidase [Trinickia fusca]RKP45269.1 hypothetical protein D7S89_20825 [Trinickia fusca]